MLNVSPNDASGEGSHLRKKTISSKTTNNAATVGADICASDTTTLYYNVDYGIIGYNGIDVTKPGENEDSDRLVGFFVVFEILLIALGGIVWCNIKRINDCMKAADVLPVLGYQFTRPTSIPANFFAKSVQAMKDSANNKYARWNFAHWKNKRNNPHKCNHDIFSHHNIETSPECCDCRCDVENIVSADRHNEEQEWVHTIRHQDSVKKAPYSNHMSMLHACGVRIDWLLAFTFDHDCWDKTTTWVVRFIVKEATKKNRCRYAHLPEMKEYIGEAETFVSHPWAGTWGNVVCAVCQGAPLNRMVWLDLFAVRQWPGRNADMKFRQIIKKCTNAIVSVSPVEGLRNNITSTNALNRFINTPEGKDAKKIIAFCRLWCVVEIAACVENSVGVTIQAGEAKKSATNSMIYYDTAGLGYLMDNLSRMIDVEEADCSNLADYGPQMKIIENMKGGIEWVNDIIKAEVKKAAISISRERNKREQRRTVESKYESKSRESKYVQRR